MRDHGRVIGVRLRWLWNEPEKSWWAAVPFVGTLLLAACGGRDEGQLDASSPEFANAATEEASLTAPVPD
jgi:hypothetical protein